MMGQRNEEAVIIMKMGKGETETCWCAYEQIFINGYKSEEVVREEKGRKGRMWAESNQKQNKTEKYI